MDKFERLSNYNEPIEGERIRDSMLQALYVQDGERPQDMAQRVVEFTRSMSERIMEEVDLDGKIKERFADLHSQDAVQLAHKIMQRHQKLTPDTVRAYFLMNIVPMLFFGAAQPFLRPDLNETRSVVAPIVSSLYEGTYHAVDGIKDDGLRFEVAADLAIHGLEDVVERIRDSQHFVRH